MENEFEKCKQKCISAVKYKRAHCTIIMKVVGKDNVCEEYTTHASWI